MNKKNSWSESEHRSINKLLKSCMMNNLQNKNPLRGYSNQFSKNISFKQSNTTQVDCWFISKFEIAELWKKRRLLYEKDESGAPTIIELDKIHHLVNKDLEKYSSKDLDEEKLSYKGLNTMKIKKIFNSLWKEWKLYFECHNVSLLISRNYNTNYFWTKWTTWHILWASEYNIHKLEDAKL